LLLETLIKGLMTNKQNLLKIKNIIRLKNKRSKIKLLFY